MTAPFTEKRILFVGTFEQWQQWQRLLAALRHPETVEGWDPTDAGTATSLAYGDHPLDPDEPSDEETPLD